ncbi:unnamed protein product [Schistocephalus solidus]|uniref:Uncharacterized protein n=1 Tax=Schistocephalus solidus TaxID=70667 RepID=A0A183TCM7_SCHSO|nr:unnamed protein product [Schistocephalus solidus]
MSKTKSSFVVHSTEYNCTARFGGNKLLSTDDNAYVCFFPLPFPPHPTSLHAIPTLFPAIPISPLFPVHPLCPTPCPSASLLFPSHFPLPFPLPSSLPTSLFLPPSLLPSSLNPLKLSSFLSLLFLPPLFSPSPLTLPSSPRSKKTYGGRDSNQVGGPG